MSRFFYTRKLNNMLIYSLFYNLITYGQLQTQRGCRKSKSFDPTFSKVGRFQGQRPWSRLASLETPKTSEKSSFFASFFLAKGKKKNYITDINNYVVSQITLFNVNATRPFDLCFS